MPSSACSVPGQGDLLEAPALADIARASPLLVELRCAAAAKARAPRLRPVTAPAFITTRWYTDFASPGLAASQLTYVPLAVLALKRLEILDLRSSGLIGAAIAEHLAGVGSGGDGSSGDGSDGEAETPALSPRTPGLRERAPPGSLPLTPSLRVLRLDGCTRLGDAGARALAQALRVGGRGESLAPAPLRALSLSGILDLTDDGARVERLLDVCMQAASPAAPKLREPHTRRGVRTPRNNPLPSPRLPLALCGRARGGRRAGGITRTRRGCFAAPRWKRRIEG